MTTVEVLYRYTTPPTDRIALALGRTRDVYGIRKVVIDAQARTVLVEFDATRLTPPVVSKLLQNAGLDLAEELSTIPALPEPVPAT